MRLITIIALSLISSIVLAAELQPNSKSPIEIFSDEVRYFNIEGKAIFTGNVVASQDDLVVKSSSMEVLFDKEEKKGESQEKSSIKTIYFKDNVDITTKTDHATAHNGEYDVKKGVFTLKGNVVLEQEGSVLTGDELIHVKDTGESLLKSKSGSRVKAHIVQKQGAKK